MTELIGPSPEPSRPRRRNPETDDFPTGPAVGEPVPDFTLPDQRGRSVNLGQIRRGGEALVVFHRSAKW